MGSPMGWCGPENRHSQCPGEYKQFGVDAKTNKVYYTGEVIKCECVKRTCDCYTKRADRTKKTTRRRKT